MAHPNTTSPVPELAILPAVLTRSEAAGVLRISLRTLDRLIASGRIKPLRGLGRHPRIARSAIERVLVGESSV